MKRDTQSIVDEGRKTRLKTKDGTKEEKRWWKARRFEQVAGISNFPLISSVRIFLLSLASSRGDRSPLKAAPLVQRAQKTLAQRPSIHPTNPSARSRPSPCCLSSTLVEFARIGLSAKQPGPRKPRSLLAPPPPEIVPPLRTAVYARWECIFGKGRETRHIAWNIETSYLNPAFCRNVRKRNR